MKTFKQFVTEAPVADIHMDIDDRAASVKHIGQMAFREKDKKYLDNPKYPAIVTRQLQQTKLPFFIYIVSNNSTRASIGTVSGGDREDDKFLEFVGSLKHLEDIDEELYPRALQNAKSNPDGVHVLIAHNDPDSDDHMNLTPWMILHRLSHGVCSIIYGPPRATGELKSDNAEFRSFMINMRDEYAASGFADMISGIRTKIDLAKVFPFKSAQNPNFKYNVYTEVVVEMFADYLFGGSKRVRMNYDKSCGVTEFHFNELKQFFFESFQKIEEMLKGKLIIG